MENKIYCSQCGAGNDKKNAFCNSCGANLDIEQVTKRTISQQQSQRVLTTQKNTSTITDSVPGFKIMAFLGLIISIISIVIFSWLGWFFWLKWEIYLWFPILFMGISLLGIVFSAVGIKGNIVIGIISLILGIIGSLIQTVLVGIIIYIWITT